MKKKKQKGYTLVEVLVIVVIVGILAYVSVPIYNKVMQKSDVSDALHNIDMFSGAQSKYFISNGSYTSNLSNLDSPLKGGGSSISTTNFTYSAGNVAEGNYCIYSKSNSRNYTLARNYRTNSEVLCSGSDCGKIDSFVKQGSLTDLCGGVYEGGECDKTCSSPKTSLDKQNCKCVCPAQNCGDKILNQDTCTCECDPTAASKCTGGYFEWDANSCACKCNKPDSCIEGWDAEHCTCNGSSNSCEGVTCDEGYAPDENCDCVCSLTAESCGANKELVGCACDCKNKSSLIEQCSRIKNYVLNEDCECVENCKKTQADCNAKGSNYLLVGCDCECTLTEAECQEKYGNHSNPYTCSCGQGDCNSNISVCPGKNQYFDYETCECVTTCNKDNEYCARVRGENFVVTEDCLCVCSLTAEKCADLGLGFTSSKCKCEGEII